MQCCFAIINYVQNSAAIDHAFGLHQADIAKLKAANVQRLVDVFEALKLLVIRLVDILNEYLQERLLDTNFGDFNLSFEIKNISPKFLCY